MHKFSERPSPAISDALLSCRYQKTNHWTVGKLWYISTRTKKTTKARFKILIYDDGAYGALVRDHIISVYDALHQIELPNFLIIVVNMFESIFVHVGAYTKHVR